MEAACATGRLAQMTADDWKWNADFLNEKAAVLKKAGIVVGYHNHNFEFAPLGATTGMEILLKGTDPSLVTFEMDVGWVTAAGQDPFALLNASITGRFTLMHVKDIKADHQAQLRAAAWTRPRSARGMIDWKKLLPAAYDAGVARLLRTSRSRRSPTPRLESAKISYDYLAERRRLMRLCGWPWSAAVPARSSGRCIAWPPSWTAASGWSPACSAATRPRTPRRPPTWGVASDRVYPDHHAMIAAERAREDGVELVSVVTPNHLHFDVSAAALRGGLHVISDKPATLNLAAGAGAGRCRRGVGPALRPDLHLHRLSDGPRGARDRGGAATWAPCARSSSNTPRAGCRGPSSATATSRPAGAPIPRQSGVGGCIGDIGVHAFNIAEFVTRPPRRASVRRRLDRRAGPRPGRRLQRAAAVRGRRARRADRLADLGRRPQRPDDSASMARRAA